jgi:hypothetical protein
MKPATKSGEFAIAEEVNIQKALGERRARSEREHVRLMHVVAEKSLVFLAYGMNARRRNEWEEATRALRDFRERHAALGEVFL